MNVKIKNINNKTDMLEIKQKGHIYQKTTHYKGHEDKLRLFFVPNKLVIHFCLLFSHIRFV